MKRFAILTFSVAALILSACSIQQQPVIQEATTTQTAPQKTKLRIKGHTEVSIVMYQCEQDIGQIEVRFFPHHGVAVLVLEEVTHEMQEQRAASGFWYSNGKYTIRGKGTDAWLEIGRRAPIDCQAENY